MNLVIWITLSFMIVAIESSTVATPVMSLTSTNMNPEVGSSVTLTCQRPDGIEITWSGPSGVYIIFASSCLRLSEAETTHITYISTTCGGGSSTLTINNFDPGRDSGTWSCSSYGISDSASISLTAAASNVESIQITTELAFIDYSDTISLLIGEQETITCSADCQNACQFTWHLNNQLVSSSAELVINDLQSSSPSSSGNYMCTASSGGDSLTKNVRINILSRNTIIFSPSDDIINVNEGDNVSVICDGMTNSFACNSQMMFECYYSWNTWSYDGTEHELRYNNITLDKTGRYYCIHEEYEQSSNYRMSIYRSVQINVIGTVPTNVTSPSTSVPTPTTYVTSPSSPVGSESATVATPVMSLTSTNMNPEVGSSVTLTCQTPGYTEITWRGPSGVYIIFAPGCFRLSEAESTHITYISATCYTLTINNFDPSRDSGSWSCSSFGISDSASISLTAAASSVENIQITTELAFIDHYNKISILSGEQEKITCSADCQNNCQFTWHLNNQLVSSSAELVINDLQSSSPSSSGNYMCTASSGGDSLTKNVAINILSRNTIIFSPSDDIINVNEGDNVSVICDGMTNSYACNSQMMFDCDDSWAPMSYDGTSAFNVLKINNITSDKTGKYYCTHGEYEQSSNTRTSIYRSVQINVIVNSTSSTSTMAQTSSATTTASTTPIPSTTTTIPPLVSSNYNPTVGSSVTLTCETQYYQQVTWSGPKRVSIIFAPNCYRLTEAESTHITYISVSCGDGSSTLTINNFDPARDAGMWSCDSHSITLTAVASTVENIKMTTELAFIDYYDTISLLNGEQETITCSADCQNACQFTWHLNNQLVSSSAELMIDLQSSSPSSRGNYMCTASSGGDSLSKNVSISTMPRNTIIFSPSDDIINVNEGDNVSVNCDGMTNSYPCPDLTGVDCHDSWNTMSYVDTSAPKKLQFNNITPDKTGRYYCIHEEYEQSSNYRMSIYRSVQINVIESATVATPVMSLTSTNLNPEVGSSVTLTCQTPGYTEITWSGPSGVSIIFAPGCFRLSEADSTHITYISATCGDGSSTLTINNFDPARDAGMWSCNGYSPSGFYDSASISLTPAASSVENIQITTELAFIDHYNGISLLNGEQETITCSADCQNACQFTWHLNNQLVSSSAELMIDLQSFSPSSRGNYMCTASSGGDSLTKNVSIFTMPRNTIIFSPSDDIINVNEGDNVSVICDGMTNSFPCPDLTGVDCHDSWNTMSYVDTSAPNKLQFNNITPDKTGKYYCIHEEYEQSSNTRMSIYRSVQINVIGTIENIQLVSSDNMKKVSPSNKLVSSDGDEITVTCSAECSSSCSYSWVMHGQIVSSTNILTLKTRYSYTALNYTCAVTLGSVLKEKELSIYVRPKVDALLSVNQFSSGNNNIVNEGDRVQLSCSAAFPPPCNMDLGYYCETQWIPYSMDTSIEPSFEFLQSVPNSQILIIPNVTKNNEKIYTCQYMETDDTLPLVGGVVMLKYTKQLNLTVHESSTTTMAQTSSATTTASTTTIPRLVSSNYNPTVDSSVTLTCQTSGYTEITWSGPKGVSIIFAPNCFRLSEAESTHITYISATCGDESSTLTINNFDPARDAGIWSCTGNSFSSESDLHSVTLTAVASTVENIKMTTELAFIDYIDTILLLNGEQETITCSADCQNACQFTWHLNNQLVSSSAELMIDLQSSSPSSRGNYMCTASSGGDSLTKNVSISTMPRNTIIFSPSDDIINVNEGDNVSVICDGMTNSFPCPDLTGVDCHDSWNTMSYVDTSAPKKLQFNNITLDKTGRYYCIHEEYEQSSNYRMSIYRSVKINVIESHSTSTSVTIPSTSVTTPSTSVTTRSTTVTTPSTSVTTSVTTPSTSATTPSTSVTTPSTSVTTPSTSVTTPSTSVTTTPSTSVTTPSTSVMPDVTTESASGGSPRYTMSLKKIVLVIVILIIQL